MEWLRVLGAAAYVLVGVAMWIQTDSEEEWVAGLLMWGALWPLKWLLRDR